jgi:DNA ligase-1
LRAFAKLYDAIDSTTSTNLKVAAINGYFATAQPADAAWAVYFLSGRKLKRLIGAAALRAWLIQSSALPDWLIEETYSQVGDLAETIALLADVDTRPAPSAPTDVSLQVWVEHRLLALKGLPEPEQQATVTAWWRELPYLQCLVVNKLLTGGFRVGVSQTLLIRALAQHLGTDVAATTHRLMGDWEPTAGFWNGLAAPTSRGENRSQPYPFFLAAPLEQAVEALGERSAWQAEWKWDGIRAQVIRRGGQTFIWSRGEELLTERFPEISAIAAQLPDGTVLDGEILAWNEAGVMPFAALQTRIARKKLTPKLLADAPARFLPYDLLEYGGEDIRGTPLRARRAQLDALLKVCGDGFINAQPLAEADWSRLAAWRQQARAHRVEGLMLKSLESVYGTGRQRGAWWKWKVDPFSVDAVMIYAQPGHGRRASLYTDYTFAVWNEQTLVPVAKAYSGLNNEEILALDRWIRQHTTERFGPVRAVEPLQVFELAFEGINASPRHKAGVALRFPRISRWRTDKLAAQADTLEQLRRLL